MSQEQTAGRRRFIVKSSAAVAATLVPRHVLGGPGFVAPSDRVNVALIGAGGQGLHNVRALLQERGLITCAGWSGMPRLLPLERHRSYVRPAKTLPRVEGHHADWLRACKGGPPASSHFGYGARLTELATADPHRGAQVAAHAIQPGQTGTFTLALQNRRSVAIERESVQIMFAGGQTLSGGE